MEYKATLMKKMDAVRISEKFVKREFVVSDKHPQYPQTILFELVNDRCKELDAFNEGDEVNVHFNIRGRDWTNKEGKVVYFVTLNAFKIVLEKKGEGVPATNGAVKAESPKQEPVLQPTPDDDLPF
jgi:hypothetical protein